VDGSSDDWKGDALYKKKEGDIRELYVDHDERYLYIRLDINQEDKGYPMVLLDVVPDQGNHFVYGQEGINFTDGVEFIINLNKNESRVIIDDYYDLYTFQYGHQLNMLQPKPSLPIKNSGHFSTIQYALIKELFLPQQKRTEPFKSYETGKLREGIGNPAAKDYDSLADYHVNEKGMVEIRIPWLLIQAKDPSQRLFTGDIFKNG
jgi:hypothetical protein